MIYKFCLLVFVCAFLVASCSKVNKIDSDVVVIDDKPKVSKTNEVVIADSEYDGGQETASVLKVSSREISKISADQSRIDTMYDQFGNKTETRCFNNDLRLKCLTLLTAADGKKKVSVYGQNGEIKTLPVEMHGRALSASANELANSAGIYQIYRQPAPVKQGVQTRNNAPLRPLPSYNFPVQIPQTESVSTDEANQTTNAADEKPNESKNDSSVSPPNK